MMVPAEAGLKPARGADQMRERRQPHAFRAIVAPWQEKLAAEAAPTRAGARPQDLSPAINATIIG
jgi:hypothetical protein